jgi:hypothetical protein
MTSWGHGAKYYLVLVIFARAFLHDQGDVIIHILVIVITDSQTQTRALLSQAARTNGRTNGPVMVCSKGFKFSSVSSK